MIVNDSVTNRLCSDIQTHSPHRHRFLRWDMANSRIRRY